MGACAVKGGEITACWLLHFGHSSCITKDDRLSYDRHQAAQLFRWMSFPSADKSPTELLSIR